MKSLRNVFMVALMIFGIVLLGGAFAQLTALTEQQSTAAHLHQFDLGDASLTQLKTSNYQKTLITSLFMIVDGAIFTWYAISNLRLQPAIGRTCCTAAALSILFCSGCYQPFEPVQLEVIQSNEYAFMLPFTDDLAKQAKSQNEEYLRKNMVFAKQVKIPQQWVSTNYTWVQRSSLNGSWKPAALLLKVTNSPVTREWTADPMSGTGNKNEAVWVMTADQVEFSTGWSCTARIASEDDAVKFLHNYPNGTLEKVLDSEVRMKLATEFALEVTDLPMEKLRKDATPHIRETVVRVTEFFRERGISITNLGITGGFVYKDPTIQATLVKAFNAEQGKNLAIAATQTQEEQNKQIQLEATGKAEARLKEAEAEAAAIKAVADAKEYEIKKAQENIAVYVALKQLEVEAKKIEKWKGEFPTTYFGEKPPEAMLTIPAVSATPGK